MAAGVDEDVEGGVGAGELVAVQHAEEGRVGQQGPQPGLLRAAAHEHEPDSRETVDVGEQLELLLGRQPADVPDQRLAVRRELGVERLVALRGLEEHLVDPARPAGDCADAEPVELVDAGRRRGQRAVDPEVDPAGQRLHGAGAAGDAVAVGEPDQVGLVDRDGRDAERAGRLRGLVAERGRRGDVHDVGPEPLHRGAEPAPGLQADPELGVERQARTAGVGDREAGVRRRAGRRDQLGVVALGREVLEHPAHGVGDAVDLGQEGLGDDQHAQPRRGGRPGGRGDREGDQVRRCGAAATPPLEQVHATDARKRSATDNPSRADDT